MPCGSRSTTTVPGLPASGLLVADLEPAETVVVEADEAEHRCGERARRVEALRLGGEPDARRAFSALTCAATVGVDLAGDVDEREVLLRRAAPGGRSRATPTIGASCAAYSIGMRDHVRVGPDRLALDREREVAAVAVEDAAALGRDA